MFSVSEFFGDCVAIPFFFVWVRIRSSKTGVAVRVFFFVRRYLELRRSLVVGTASLLSTGSYSYTHTRNGTSGTKSKLELWEFSYLSLSLLLLLRLLESKIGLELVPDRRVMTSFTVVDVVVFVLVLILICEGRGGGGDFL